nr:tyrosine-type recombinase/integrase [Enterovibrio nigricans]
MVRASRPATEKRSKGEATPFEFGERFRRSDRIKSDKIRLFPIQGKQNAAREKAATINRNHNRLSSVFTVLITAGEYYGEHPLKGLSKLSEPSREMGFLSLSEVKALIDKLDGDPLLIARVCLETGARWSEAATLTKSQVVNGKITFLNTKNGKNRTVPIHVELSNALVKQPGRKLFAANCYGAFYAVLKEMAFDLPKGQAAHVLRHTFASHFIMNGGNILTLQKVLGHANILQTMTYAHLAPDYLSEAIALNPLSTFRPNCQN